MAKIIRLNMPFNGVGTQNNPRKKYGRDESRLQIKCVRNFKRMFPKILIWHTPNGGARSKSTANFLKLEGVLAGVPDLFIAHVTKKYAGLFVELKSGKNSTSKQQKILIEQLRKAGYRVEVVKTEKDFLDLVQEYCV